MPVAPALPVATKSFYKALNAMLNGNHEPMLAVWSQTPAATTMHPIGGIERGWSKVKGPWGMVASVAKGGKVKLTQQRIVATKDMAIQSGVEVGTATLAGTPITINHRVTNVYVRQGREWKITHHHADVSAEMVAVVKGLQETGA
jgi:ketosteroid isomerase-like protein